MRRGWVYLVALIAVSGALLSACSSLPESLPFGNNAEAQEAGALQTAPVVDRAAWAAIRALSRRARLRWKPAARM